MRIIVHDYLAYPFVRQLASRGHDLLLLHGGGVRQSRGATARGHDDAPTLAAEPVSISERLKTCAGPVLGKPKADTGGAR
jgi:hypothetical protein